MTKRNFFNNRLYCTKDNYFELLRPRYVLSLSSSLFNASVNYMLKSNFLGHYMSTHAHSFSCLLLKANISSLNNRLFLLVLSSVIYQTILRNNCQHTVNDMYKSNQRNMFIEQRIGNIKLHETFFFVEKSFKS
jgi:hypothetical protein